MLTIVVAVALATASGALFEQPKVDCGDPAARAKFLQEQIARGPLLDRLMSKSSARQQHVAALMDRLTERGQYSGTEKAGLKTRMMTEAGISGAGAQSAKLAGEMTEALQATKASKSDAAMCEAIIDAMGKVHALDAFVSHTQDAVEGWIRAEAKRRKVKLEP